MNKNIKKLFLLTTVLMILFTISAIDAAETNNDTIIDDAQVSSHDIISDSVKGTVADTSDNKEIIKKDIKNDIVTKSASTHIVNNDNVDEIFNGEKYTLGDSISEGDTLDFQGTIDKEHSLVINKPIRIISSTKDAVISLHTQAGSYFGDDSGNSFVVNKGGSNSYISGLYLYNTECWIYNTYNTTLYNMTMHVENARVGSGVGQTALRYSNNVTMDSCHIYTENNGGSSSFVWTGCNNCTIVNSTIEGVGSVGNLLYVGNGFNTNDKPADYVMSNFDNNVINCTVIGGSGGISNPLQNGGTRTLIQGNKFYSGGSASAGTNGTLIDNEFYRTVGVTMTANCVAHGNVFYGTGSATIQANAQVYDNVFNNATISGANVLFENNTVKSRLTVSTSANIENNNLHDVQINTNGKVSNITNNNVTGTITSQAADVTITNNNITSKNDYTVVVKNATNVITNNYLQTPVKAGEETIDNQVETTTIENNTPESGKTLIITDETYSQYFDASGKIKGDQIKSYDTVILTGVFNDKIFDIDNVKVTFEGDEAVINNGYFSSSADATILVQNLVINNTADVEYSVIFESNLNKLRNVTIYRYSREGATHEVYVSGEENTIENNVFDLDVATQPVDFTKSPAMADVSAITIVSNNNKVQKNTINVKTSKNDYGTLNVIDIASSTQANKNTITENIINVEGTDYIYAINMGINTNENTVTSNNITLTSDNYAAGIQIMNGPSNDNTINSNNINITSTSAAYGILITAWENPEVAGNIFNSNKINVTADQAYGMEMYSSNPAIVIKDTTVNSNTIKADGNNAMGIVFSGKDSIISQNTLTVAGSSNATVEDSYDQIKATTAGIILQDSDNINDYNNTINTTNGANHLLINTNNSRVISTTSTMTRYINAIDNANIVLKSSNNNVINTQRAYTTGAYSVELTASSNNVINNNILNASNIVGGNSAVKQDADSKDNIIEDNKPVFGLLTEETYSTLFDENGVYTYPEGVEILTLAGDLYNKDLIFNNNVTFTNSKNYTIYNGTIYLSENPNGNYANRFVYINDININNTNKPALYDNLTTTQQRNIQYYGGSITVTGDADNLVGIYSIKNNATYAIIDVERATVNMDGKNVIFAIMTRPVLSRNDYIDIENNNINLKSTGLNVVIYDQFANIDLLKNNITQTGGQAVTVYANSAYANGKFFGENNIDITADTASALILTNGQANNPTVGNNNITVTSPNPSVVINITDSGNAYVGQGQYSYSSYNYPNTIIVDGYNGDVPVVTVTPNGYVRNNFIMSKDLWGADAVEANTVSNITPTGVITDNTYSQYFDEEGFLKPIFNNSNLTVSGAISNKNFLFDGVNVNITSDGTAKLTETEIWTGNDAKVTLDGLQIENTKDAVVFESEGNILNNTQITINSEDEVHAISIMEDANTIANTVVDVTAPAGDVQYNADWSTKAPAPTGVLVSSSNNVLDNVTVNFNAPTTTGSYPTVNGLHIGAVDGAISNNTVRNSKVTVKGTNYAYGINVGNAKDTTLENVEVAVESDYYADAIQLFDADGITMSGTADAKAATQAYGIYSTAMGTGASQNIDATGLDVTVEAPDATGALFEGSSNIKVADATYTITGDKAIAIDAHVDWMGNIPTNITVTGLDVTIDTTGDANILYFGKAADVTVTENHIEANAGSAININATPNASITDNYILVGEMLETGIFGNYAVTTTEEDTVVENNEPTSKIVDDLNDKIKELEEQLAELNKAKETTITIDPLDSVHYDNEITISGTLVNEDSLALSNQNVTIKFNDEEVTVTTRNGEFKYTTTAKIIGENTITATYAGNDKYQASEATYTFEVAKANTYINLTELQAVKKGDVTSISGTLYDENNVALENAVVRLLVNNGRKTVKTNKMGEFSFDYTTTKVGELTVTATYEGNDYYEATSTDGFLTVNALSTTITIDPIEQVTKGSPTTISGTLTDEKGNAIVNAQVKIMVNGSPKTVKTDSEGRFTHTYTFGQIGENTIEVTYAGSANYVKAENQTTVEVVKAQPVITLDQIDQVNKGETATFTGKLTDAEGNAIANAQIKLTINGSQKTLTTDADGAFTHTFKMTKEGTNNITAVFNGNNDYAAAETNSTVMVIKAE